jgi:acyl carrier protein
VIDDVVGILGRELMVPQEELTADTPLDSIVKDSIDVMSVIAALQAELDVSVDSDDLAGVTTVGHLGDLVRSKREGAGRGAAERL